MGAARDDTTRGPDTNAARVSGHLDAANPYADRPRPPCPPTSWLVRVALFGLWALTGAVGLVSVFGILSIGAYVLPFAIAACCLAVWLTVPHPDRWPSVTGVGVALGAAVAWVGSVIGTASPDQVSCSGSSNGPTTCTSHGLPYDPQAFAWSTAAFWLVLGLAIAGASVAAFVVVTRVTTGAVRSP